MSTLLDQLESDLQTEENYSGVPLYTLELSTLSEGDQLQLQKYLEALNNYASLSDEITFLKARTTQLEASVESLSLEKVELEEALNAAKDTIQKNAQTITSEVDSKEATLTSLIEANEEALNVMASASSKETLELKEEVEALTAKLVEQENKLVVAEAEIAEERAAREAGMDSAETATANLTAMVIEFDSENKADHADIENMLLSHKAESEKERADVLSSLAEMSDELKTLAEKVDLHKRDHNDFAEGSSELLADHEKFISEITVMLLAWVTKLAGEAQLSADYQVDMDETSLQQQIVYPTEWPAGTTDEDGYLAEMYPWMSLPT